MEHGASEYWRSRVLEHWSSGVVFSKADTCLLLLFLRAPISVLNPATTELVEPSGQPDLPVLDLLVQDFTGGGIHALHTSFASSGDARIRPTDPGNGQ